jgi:NADH:ubiquinone oxidoreductase subunit E
MNYKDIQNEVIKKYRIDICDGTRCKDGKSIFRIHEESLRHDLKGEQQ